MGFVVSIIDPRTGDRIRATISPRALGFIALMLTLILLHAVVILGAVDCDQDVDSIACKFAQFIAK